MDTREVFVPVTEHTVTTDMGSAPTMDMLRSNPLIQQMMEERMAMPCHRKSGTRYNVSDTLHAMPHLRWPNESCVIGTARKRATFDELTLGQFVIGFINNVLDTQHVPTMRSMLNELAENISWPIARGAFAVSMLKIEDENITWADTRTLGER